MQFIAEIHGGLGPNVWDKELELEADTITKALKLAVQRAVSLNGTVGSIEQADFDSSESNSQGEDCKQELQQLKRKLQEACGDSDPSDGHDYADEIIGLLRVARQQRDDMEKQMSVGHARNPI